MDGLTAIPPTFDGGREACVDRTTHPKKKITASIPSPTTRTPTDDPPATAKPTYLKGSTDAVVTAAGLAGLTLVFIRTMAGFVDMG